MSGTDALPRERPHVIYRVLLWCGEFILMLGFWFLLTDKANFSEFAAGAIATFVSLFAVHVCIREPFSRLFKYPRYVFQMWRIPMSVLSGIFQVFYALAQQLFTQKGASSSLRLIPFRAGTGDAPEAKLRRTLALTYPSCSPNFVAIEIDRTRSLYIYHQVKPTSPSQLLKNLTGLPYEAANDPRGAEP